MLLKRQFPLIIYFLFAHFVGKSSTEVDGFFEDCGKSRSCYAIGRRSKVLDNCWVDSECFGGVVLEPPTSKNGNVFKIMIRFDSTLVTYAAFGISPVSKIGMQNLTIFECVLNGKGADHTTPYISRTNDKDSLAEPKRAYNTPKDVNVTVYGYDLTYKTYAYCDWTIPASGKFIVSEFNEKFDLKKTEYYVAVACGRVNKTFRNSREEWVLTRHKAAWITPTKIRFTEIQDPYNFRYNTLQNIHGVLMTFVYFTLMPVATLIARFFRETWSQKQVWKKRAWFCIHVVLLSLGLICVIAGYAVMAYDTKEYFPHYKGAIRHAYIGLSSMILFVVQAIVPWLVPSSNFKAKEIYSYIHALGGFCCYVLGVINIGMVPILMPKWYGCPITLITAFWIATNASIYVIFSALLIINDHEMSNNTAKFRALFSYPMRIKTMDDAPGVKERLILLGTHISLSLFMDCIMFYEIFQNSQCIPWYGVIG